MSEPCVFCEIIERRSPASVVAENDGALAFLTIGPLRAGHALVIPKRHLVELVEATPVELADVMTLVADVARRQRRALDSGGENVLLASGVVAEQSVFHLHFHVVPRAAGDGIDLAAWWESTMMRPKPTRASLENIALRLREA